MEFVRHRIMSFAQESTRYCNYSKDKFGDELTFIIPNWISDIPDNTVLKDSMDVYHFVWQNTDIGKRVIVSKFTQIFLYHCIHTEDEYIGLINHGYKPQEARAVLPNSLKTELVVTGFASDWNHFFELRDSSNAHPQAYELAHPLYEEFISRKYL